MFKENNFSAGQNWIARAIERATKGLSEIATLSIESKKSAVRYFEFSGQYDLAIVDSSDHSQQAELWLSPKNTGFLAILIDSIKHDKNYTEKRLDKLIEAIKEKSQTELELKIVPSFSDYVTNKNKKTNGNPKVNFSGFDLSTVKSTRLRTEASRWLREAVAGRTKVNHWDKVSLG